MTASPRAAATQASQTATYDTATAAPVSGPFVWHDLMSTTPARSAAFYASLFGWQMEGRDLGPAGTYTYIRAGEYGEHAFGGIVPLDPRLGIAAHWVSYVLVDDVDATCARANAAGGKTCIPPTDIPNVGRFAMLEDPGGAVLSPISLRDRSEAPSPRALPAPGTPWWHELATTVPDAATAFYAAVFGWRVQRTTTPDGAPYWLFLRGEVPVGGMLRASPPRPARAHWLIYVTVSDADLALGHAESLGAAPTFPCVDLPGAGRVGGFVDPVGAAMAVGQPMP